MPETRPRSPAKTNKRFMAMISLAANTDCQEIAKPSQQTLAPNPAQF